VPAAPLLWRMTPHAYAWRARDDRQPVNGVPGMLAEGVEHADRAGYDGIEASLAWVVRPGVADALAAELARRDLVVDALFASLSVDAGADVVDRLAAQAKAARPTGYRFLNVVTVPTPAQRREFSPTFDGPVPVVAALVGGLARALENTGLVVAWHPHDVSLRDGVDEVLGQVGQDVRLCLDLGWVGRAGLEPVAVLRRLADRVATVHVRDLRADGEWCEAVGEGVFDLAGTAAELDRLGHTGPTAVELMFERSTTVTRSLPENAALSATALRKHAIWAG
jgi:sugar phosphate isomerase/epimerase